MPLKPSIAYNDQPMADALALRSIQLMMEYLPKCVENGKKDLFARGQQALAATMAGIAFTNSQTAMVHAIAHMLGGLYKVPRGLANSILLPHVVRFNECTCRIATTWWRVRWV